MKHFQDFDHALGSKSSRNRTIRNQPLVPVYRVGELFRRGHHSWPMGSQFNYSPGGLELTLFLSDIRDDMIDEVRCGQAEFAIIIEPSVIVFAYRFGQAIPWEDALYAWHLQPADRRVVPSLKHSPETRALLWISLVGADDGIIHAQRGVTLSPSFTLVLHSAIRAQAMATFDPAECTLAISRLFLRNRATVDLLPYAVAQTMANE